MKTFADIFYEKHKKLNRSMNEHLTYCKFVEFEEAISCGHDMRNNKECAECWNKLFQVEDEY